MQDNGRLTYDVKTAAKLLGLSKNSAYQACLTGQIPCLKIGKRILIPRAQLDRMLNEAGKAKD
ncbi:MAG TPA: helix-turn-helix domain-containing protein [Dehalococcoidia bacterium]|nr:helix-turn-helix domain-containing protein [Dehalococcoidia bacterium]